MITSEIPGQGQFPSNKSWHPGLRRRQQRDGTVARPGSWAAGQPDHCTTQLDNWTAGQSGDEDLVERIECERVAIRDAGRSAWILSVTGRRLQPQITGFRLWFGLRCCFSQTTGLACAGTTHHSTSSGQNNNAWPKEAGGRGVMRCVMLSGARQSLKRSRDWAEAGRSLLFNYVQTGPLTRFRPGLGRPSAQSAGPAQRARVA